MKKKNQAIALLMTVAIVLVMLFSALFITVEAGHSCSQSHCPICAQISLCSNILKGFSLLGTALAIAAVIRFSVCGVIIAIKNALTQSSLVTLKVKLSS